MSWCWGKEVTKLDSWSGLRGSDPVIDRRIVAELMTNVMIRGVKKREAQVHQISLSEALKVDLGCGADKLSKYLGEVERYSRSAQETHA